MKRISSRVSRFSLSVFGFPPPSTCPSHLLSQSIADSSKILTNIGLIYATLGEHETAVQQFIAATSLDNYLAVASVPIIPPWCSALILNTINSSYFQCGVSNFLLGHYDRASKDFEEALLYLRGNQSMYATRTTHFILSLFAHTLVQ
jgi:tetratricopeptide (TPR) repeat protein